MDPDRFRELSRDFRAEAVNDLCRAILFDSKCCAYLTSSELLSREASVEVGRAVARLDPNLELQLARHALSCVEEGASEAALQSLAILDGIGAGARINPLLVKIAHLDDRKVRSRATALLVKTCRSPKQIELWLGDPDPRVRGNIPESLTPAEFNRYWLEKVFLNCASDENH